MDKFEKRLVAQTNSGPMKKKERIQSIKNNLNVAVATAAGDTFNSYHQHSALILDGAEGNTTHALKDLAGVNPHSILSPNNHPLTAKALKELGVCAWCGWVEDFLRLPVTTLPSLNLVYLDHTGAFPSRQWQVRNSFKLINNETGGVLAFTFSTRSGRWQNQNKEETTPPTSTWGAPEAIYSLTSTFARHCEERGWDTVDMVEVEEAKLGLQKYELNPPHPHGLVRLAESLASWVESNRGGRINEHKLGAAEAAAKVLLGRRVLGCVWSQATTEEAKEPFRPSHVNTDMGGVGDNDIRRLLNISRGLDLDVSNIMGPPTFKSVMMYPEQMMWLMAKVAKKKRE